MPWTFDEATDPGGRREQQDRAAVFSAPDGDRHLLVVADGMGGHRQGMKAAETVINVAKTEFHIGSVSDPAGFLTKLCARAHQAVNALGRRGSGSPGSTCVFLYLHDKEAHWAHIGDSRLYLVRKGRPQFVTVDHSLAALLESEDSTSHRGTSPRSSRSQLYMRLGGGRAPEPGLGSTVVMPGDLFLLCSDGFWSTVSCDEASGLLDGQSVGKGCAGALVALASQRGGKHGDNVGLALAQWLPRRQQWKRGLLRYVRALLPRSLSGPGRPTREHPLQQGATSSRSPPRSSCPTAPSHPISRN